MAAKQTAKKETAAKKTAKKPAAKQTAKKETATKKPAAKQPAKKVAAKPVAKPTAKKEATKPAPKKAAKETVKPAAKKVAAKSVEKEKPAESKPAATKPTPPKLNKDSSSIEYKLRLLYDLQIIDSRIDKIRTIRGELPLEVQDLEDEIVGLTTRVEKAASELNELKESVTAKEKAIAEAKALIKKYEQQQNKVRNNREFDSLTKEIEFQNLEIELAEKHIKEYKYDISNKTAVLEESTGRLEEKQKDLDTKKAELDEIVKETEKEEEILLKKSAEASKDVDSRLLTAYHRIRSSSKNGLAVVPIERGASGGSFIKIPPQKQLDVAARKKVIVDEHSGKILVDEELANEESERINTLISKLIK